MAKVVIGATITADAKGANESVGSFRKQLRDAQQDVIKLSEQFGPLSKEAVNAAKKAAELKDRIGDAKNLMEGFNPDRKFQAFSSSIQGVVGGFTALQGVMGLVGSESEDVAKTLLKVQSALAISQGINQIGELKDQFTNLWAVLKNNLGTTIPLAVAGIGLVILKMFEWKREQTALSVVNEQAIKSSIEQRTKLDLLTHAAQNTALSTKDRLAKVKELQDEFPGYFNNIKTEKDLNDKLTTAYNNATAGILAKAKATAAFNKIVENENKILEIQRKTQDYSDQFSDKKFNAGALIAKVKAVNDARIEVIKKENEVLANVAQQGPAKGLTVQEEKQINDEEKAKAETRLAAKIFWEGEAKRKRAEEMTKGLSGIGGKTTNEGFDSEGLSVEDHSLAESSRLRTGIETGEALERIKISQAEKDAKTAFNHDIGESFGALSDLVGKQTAVGKGLAVAQAVINTWQGATEVLRAKSVLPEPAATISKVVNFATVVATGFKAVKEILKVKVAGGGGSGGGAGISSTAPITPQLSTTNTLLNAQAINNQGNGALRAFVIESDVTNNQERIRRLNRAARIG